LQTTWEQTLWINHNPIQRQFIALVVSVLILILVLMIPVSLKHHFSSQENIIEVELSKETVNNLSQQTVNEKSDQPETYPKVEVEPITDPVKEQIVGKPSNPNKTIETMVDKKPVSVTPKIVEQPSPKPKDEQMAKLPSSTDIFNSAYGKVKLYELDEDFKASTGHEDDFKLREIKQPEWNIVTKLINEEVDKPRVEMNFYSAGIVGATEKFFDKISYKKVFTTRYGTKIACGGVGPLLMCSWK